MRVLGLVARTHDSGVALLKDGSPELVLEEERLNREKRTKKFPERGLRAAFAELGLGIGDVDAVTVPWDAARLRKAVLGLVTRRLPLSLSLLLPSAHPVQGSKIVVIDRY
ncbi:MAG TPA: carbamoyltransferase N-terminal domain-containing protein, partial [Hyphomicrobiaceae bacterium]|nr:carbamoyltransferase N-terminal domain-containing protein [Hyphomicrobiaceae bacterium]